MLASSNLPSDTNEIQLHSDGSWSTHVVVKKESKVKASADLDESVQIIDDGMMIKHLMLKRRFILYFLFKM